MTNDTTQHDFQEAPTLYSVNEEESLLQKDVQIKRTTSGLFGSIFNLSNAVLGGGILSFPYAFAEAGLIGGITATIFLLIFAFGALITIVVTSDYFAKDGANSYQSLVRVVYGLKVEMIMIISIAVYGFGGCVTFLVIIGDQLTPFVEQLCGCGGDDDPVWYASRKFIIFMAGMIFVFPLCLLKRISLLGYSSFIAIVMVYYFTLMVAAFSLLGTVDSTGAQTLSLVSDASTIFSETTWWNLSLQFFQCAPIICFAFQCHLSSVPIYNELSDRTPKRMAIVCAAGLSNCLFLYTLAGITGYLTFLCSTQSDVLLNYDLSNTWVIICRFGMGIVAGFSYPILNFVSRLAVNDFIVRIASAIGRPFEKEDAEDSNLRFYSITLVFFFASLLIALFVPNVNAVISLIGSIFATLFIFGFPGCFLVTISKFKAGNTVLLYKLLGYLYLIVGVIVGGVSLAISLYNDVETVLGNAAETAC